jgi:phosphatidate cytidylyltransferase
MRRRGNRLDAGDAGSTSDETAPGDLAANPSGDPAYGPADEQPAPAPASGRHRHSADGGATVATVSRSARRSKRAGRNLPAAIAVGLLLGAVIVASLLVDRRSFVAVLIVAVVVGVVELVNATSAAEARPPMLPLIAGAIAMELAAWFRGPGGLVVGLLVTAGGVAIWRLGEGAASYLRDVSTSVLIALYVPLLAGFAVLLAHPADGAGRVLAFIGTVVCSDTGGYATGVLFGKHPLAPRVSKAKTWEGLLGSLVACCVAGVLLLDLTFHQDWWKGLIFGAAIALTAVVGDLGESMIKRDLGRKDMGRLLPGHGGLMDRLDSLLPCAAVAYLLLIWLAPA